MKKTTRKRVRSMLDLMKRKKAYFYKGEDGSLNYTYPKKHGWVNEPTIDGIPLVYVAKHDKDVE